MRYRRFGKTDMKVSVIGLGTWQAGMKSWGKNYTLDDVVKAINVSFENGVNFVDTAEIYGGGKSEEVLGEILKDWKDVYVATKISGYNARPGKIEKAVRASLRRLNRRSIDLYQIHWPPSYYTSLCKVIREMERLVDMGLVRYIGVSNFSYKDLEDILSCTHRYEIVSNQVRYNLLYRAVEKKLYPYMVEHGIELIAWSPICKGALAGKFKADSRAKFVDSAFRRVRKAGYLLNLVGELAGKYGVSMAQISLAWIVAKGGYPIPGAKRPEQAIDNARAGDIVLGSDDIKRLDEASKEYLDGRIGSVMPRSLPNILQEMVVKLMGGI